MNKQKPEDFIYSSIETAKDKTKRAVQVLAVVVISSRVVGPFFSD